MGVIQTLADEVINCLAAGEVVEKPASVLKELVENSLDAGATQIDVSIIGGGSELICVTDNGHGMSAEDAVHCFGRHATSKLREFDDMLTLNSLGFRGEALAAIASVSRVRLCVRRPGNDEAEMGGAPFSFCQRNRRPSQGHSFRDLRRRQGQADLA